MARFSLKDHFTWMVIAGVVVAANGVIQTVGGAQPLGLASLAVGLLLIGLGLARPRAMSRDRSAQQSVDTSASVGGWFRLIRPVGLLLIVAALVVSLFAGLPTYFRDGNAIPTAVTQAMWVGLGLGIALLAFDWQRQRGASRRRLTGLVVGIVLGLMTVVAATTTVVREGVIAAWTTFYPAKKVLVFAFAPSVDQPPDEMMLAETERGLARFLEAYGEFHPPKRVADANFAVLLARDDTLADEDLSGIVQSGYFGFHLVLDKGTRLPAEVANGAPAPDGYRLMFSDDEPLLIASEPFITSSNVVNQNMSSGPDGEPRIMVRFDESGAARFGEITMQNVGRRLAIVNKDRVLSAPVIREPIPGDTGQISGALSAEEAFRLVRALNIGGLPAPLVLISESVIVDEKEAR